MNATAINAIFDQVLDQLDTERRQTEGKEEIAFFRAQHNAFSKAALHFAEGVEPRWTGASYLVRSATRPDSVVHRVRRFGDVLVCSCEATGFCWHAALVSAIEQAGQSDGADQPAYADAKQAMDELFA